YVVAPYEGLLLRPTPLLQFPFIFHGICDAIKPLREYERYWSASRGIAAKGSGIVLSNSYFQRRARCSYVEASVRASKNIKKSALSHFHHLVIQTRTSS